MAIGRLDEDSEGLLLFTTDGRASMEIRNKNIEKEYYVQVDGVIGDDAIEILRGGIEISIEGRKYKTLPCNVTRLEDEPLLPPRARNIRGAHHGPTSWISVTITEGKFRQVRKMTAAAGFPTLRLVRVRVGETVLGELKPGEVKEIFFSGNYFTK